MTTTSERVLALWDWCRDAYLRIANRRLEFPKDTDKTKTYQWRFLTALNKKFIEWGLSDELCKAFIDTAVRYAVDRKLLRKGLAVLLQHNLLDECYRRLQERTKRNDDIKAILTRTKLWLDQEKNKQQTDLTSLLLHRANVGAYPNIVRWYTSGQLPEIYLALSRSCGVAISRLDEHERALLPTNTRLCLLQHMALSGIHSKFAVKNILGDDWRQPCR